MLRTRGQLCYLFLFFMVGIEPAQAQPRTVRSYLKRLQAQAQPLTPAAQRKTTALFVAGICGLMVDKPEEALQHLQQALQLAPCNAAIHFKLAYLFQQYPQLATKATTTALTYLYTAMALAPCNPFYYLGAVMLHINQGASAQATQVYQQMFQHIPPTDTLLVHLAGLYMAQKDYRQAIRVYDQLEQRQGVTPALSQYKQRLYLALNDLEEAVAEAVQLIQAYPQTKAYVMNLTRLLGSNDQAHRAIPYLQVDIALNPGHDQARLCLAQLLLAKGAQAQAIVHAPRALAATSLPLQHKPSLLQTYIEQLPPEATPADHQAMAQALCQAHPQQAPAYGICGDLYFALQDPAQALAYYLQALALDKTIYALWQRIVALYATQQNTAKVQQLTPQALQRFPHQAALYYYQALAYVAQKQYPCAAAALEKGKALAVAPAMIQLLISHLGDVYCALKQYAQAEACYEEVLRQAPLHCHVLNNYSYCLAQRQAKLLHAKKMAKKLLKQCPTEATYLDTYAWVLYQLGDYKQAKKYLKKAIALGGTEVRGEILAHYRAVLDQLGQRQEALGQRAHAHTQGYEEAPTIQAPPSEHHE